MYLTPTDYQQFKFSDYIFLINSYWRINKITGYSLREQTATVELVKIIEGLPSGFLEDCDLLFDQVEANTGEIKFTDGEGTPQNATEACCTSYGINRNIQTLFRDLGGGNVICFSPDLKRGSADQADPMPIVPPVNAEFQGTWDDVTTNYTDWVTLEGQDTTKIPPSNQYFQLAANKTYQVNIIISADDGSFSSIEFEFVSFILFVNSNVQNILLSPISISGLPITLANITVEVDQDDGIRVALDALSGSGNWGVALTSLQI
jgi:hypothetical protein